MGQTLKKLFSKNKEDEREPGSLPYPIPEPLSNLYAERPQTLEKVEHSRNLLGEKKPKKKEGELYREIS